MAPVSIVLGVMLIALGLGVYYATGHEHPTALIPTWFGIAFLLLGIVGLKDSLRKHAMHLAAMAGLLGFLGAAYAFIRRMMKPDVSEHLAAPASQAVMAVLCGAFLVLCIRSFVEARRRRKERAGTETIP